MKVPKLHCHKASGQARVTYQGRHRYFGKWGDPSTIEAYHRWAAEIASGEPQAPKPGSGILVSEIVALYLEYTGRYYAPSSSMHLIVKKALEPLVLLYGSTPAAEFGPKALRVVRGTWLNPDDGEPLTRNTVNKYTGTVRRMFRWAASQELIDVTVYQALATLDNVRKRRTTARETAPIMPVNDRHLEKVLAIAPRVMRDMIQVQLLTGARPGEVCALRRGDIDVSGDVWLAVLQEHKGAWRESAQPRTIAIGPQAQVIIKNYLLRPADAYVFDPREAVAERPAKKHRRRPGQAETKRLTARKVRDHYDAASYRHAIERLCEKAGVPAWNPNQVRKLAATRAREVFGLDGAQILLGHSNANITEVYAKLDQARLVEIAKRLG